MDTWIVNQGIITLKSLIFLPDSIPYTAFLTGVTSCIMNKILRLLMSAEEAAQISNEKYHSSTFKRLLFIMQL